MANFPPLLMHTSPLLLPHPAKLEALQYRIEREVGNLPLLLRRVKTEEVGRQGAVDVSMTLPATEAAATRKTHHRPARSPRERGLTRGRGQHSPHRHNDHG